MSEENKLFGIDVSKPVIFDDTDFEIKKPVKSHQGKMQEVVSKSVQSDYASNYDKSDLDSHENISSPNRHVDIDIVPTEGGVNYER